MRICYIALKSTHTRRWMRYFANNGHEVHLISSIKLSDYDAEKVTIHVLKRFGPHIQTISPLMNSVPAVLQVRRLIKNLNPDILHAHYIREDITLLGALSGFHPFVVTAWGSDVFIDAKKSRFSKSAARYALKRADLITSDGENMREPLVELGADPRKIRLVYFGVDTRKFNPEQRDEGLREKLGILDSPAVVSLRQVHNPLYDIESLINAIPLVLKEVPQTKFVIAGGMGDNPLETNLKELAKSLGVWDSIRFLGWLTEEELPQYLASADIYVSTSLSDAGLAASTAEAMACGLPVVITDFGDNRRWVEDGVNGFIIPLRAPEALASKLIYLLKNKEAQRTLGRKNREIIVERNNWEKEMGKMGKLYEQLIEKYRK